MKRRQPLTAEQIELLRIRYADTDNDVLAEEFGVPSRMIGYQAVRLGLKKRSPYRPKQGPNKLRNGRLPTEIESFIRDNHAVMDDMSLARRFGVADRTVRRWAKLLGLKRHGIKS